MTKAICTSIAAVMKASTGCSSQSLSPISAMVRNRPNDMSETRAMPGCMLGQFHKRPRPLGLIQSAAMRRRIPASRQPTKAGSVTAVRATKALIPYPNIKAKLSQSNASSRP